MTASPVHIRTDLTSDERDAGTSAAIKLSVGWEPLSSRLTQRADAAAGNTGSMATATPQETDPVRDPILLLPQTSSRPVGFVALQEWEGYVIDVRDEDFVARLWDLTGGARREEEEATIPFVEIAERDRLTMRLGSIFRWSIGYEHTEGGTKRRVSQIVFRDLPVVTKADLDEASEWATETLRLLGL